MWTPWESKDATENALQMVNQETVKNKSIIQSEDSTNHVKCVIDSGKSNSQADLPAADVRSGNLSIPMGTMTYHALRLAQ